MKLFCRILKAIVDVDEARADKLLKRLEPISDPVIHEMLSDLNGPEYCDCNACVARRKEG